MSVAGEAPQYLSIVSGDAFLSAKNLHPASDHVRSGDLVAVSKDRIRVLGRGVLPETHPADARSIADGRSHRAYVKVSGVIRSVVKDELDDNYQWLVLSTPNGIVYAAVTEYDYPPDRLLELRDTAVELRGRVARFLRWRNFLRYHILVYGTDGIRPLKPEPGDFSGLHRQTFRGRVLGCGAGRLFITSDDGEFLPVKLISATAPVEPGRYASVIGFVELGPNGRQLVEATLQSVSGTPVSPSPPHKITAKDLRESYGQIVQLKGVVTGVRSDLLQGDSISLSCEGHPITIDTSNLAAEVKSKVEISYMIEVAGICFAQFNSEVGLTPFPAFGGFTLIPRNASDIHILSRPSWWTPGKFLCIIAFLLVTLCILTVRNRLRIRTARMRADAKMEERTHLAVELHDSLSQTLTGIALQIDAAIKAGKGMPESSLAVLQTARRMLASCRHELKCCLWDLRTRIFDDKDMTDAVRRTVSPHVGETTVSVRFNVPRRRLSDNTAHTILRIIRELATNAVRHGGARHLKIAGEFRDGLVRCSVQDDGCGFDLMSAPGPAQGHFGLQGIRERLRERQGKMSAESTPGKGSRFVISLPSDEEPS